MSDDQYPKPDPAAAAAIAKAKRLMALTLGLTFIALAVVLAIIGYRLFTAGESGSTVGGVAPPVRAVIALGPVRLVPEP